MIPTKSSLSIEVKMRTLKEATADLDNALPLTLSAVAALFELRIDPQLGGSPVTYTQMCSALKHFHFTEAQAQERWNSLQIYVPMIEAPVGSIDQERRIDSNLGGAPMTYTEMCQALEHLGLTQVQLQAHWASLQAMPAEKNAAATFGEERRIDPGAGGIGGTSVTFAEMCCGHPELTEPQLKEHWDNLQIDCSIHRSYLSNRVYGSHYEPPEVLHDHGDALLPSADGGFNEFASAAVAAYTQQLANAPVTNAQFYEHYSGITEIPEWLSPKVFGPCLEAAICTASAVDIVSMIREIEHSQQGALGADIWNKLHVACSNAGSRGVWAMLVAGGSTESKSSSSSSSQDSWLWREILWRLGVATLHQKHCQIAQLLQEWALSKVSADWGRQLVEIEEAMGWCNKNLDSIQITNNSVHRWGFISTDRPNHALAFAHATAAVHIPARYTPAVLLPDMHKELRSLQAERIDRTLGPSRCHIQQRKEVDVKNPVKPFSLPEDKFISFSKFKQLVEGSTGLHSYDLPLKWNGFQKYGCSTGAEMPQKPARHFKKGAPSPRLRSLRVV
jgi:hypothetical protein